MKQILAIVPILSLFLLLVGCRSKEQRDTSEQKNEKEQKQQYIEVSQKQFSKMEMQLGSIQQIPLQIGVQTTGHIDVPPQNRALVTAMMGGYVKETPLLIGDIVKQGQKLLTLENPDFISLQQEYLEVARQLTYLQSEYERQKTLVAENISSQKKFLKAESEYKTSLASYNGLQKRLSLLNIVPSQVEKGNITAVVDIYAPISGSITKVHINKGMYVSPATEMMEIVDNDHIHLELNVFEKDILKIKKDQKIRFTIPETSNKLYKATVHLIGTDINKNRTIRIHGHLNDTSANTFLTGMFVNATIITDTEVSEVLPETAIISYQEKPHVLVVQEKKEDGYTFDLVKVVVGKTIDGYTQVIDADQFNPQTQFLTKGGFYLVGESEGHDH